MSTEKIEAYYEAEHTFKEGISLLREIALKTTATETIKWGSPVYTFQNKNVFWIAKFKHHFGLGFFNGIFLKDTQKILVNAQEGKTQAMRHWKFNDVKTIDQSLVLAYMNEAIANQEKGLKLLPKKKKKTELVIPELLQKYLTTNPIAKKEFASLTPYKQKEYAEYISSAKQEKTKISRLEKIQPMIEAGKGLNDKYRNC